MTPNFVRPTTLQSFEQFREWRVLFVVFPLIPLSFSLPFSCLAIPLPWLPSRNTPFSPSTRVESAWDRRIGPPPHNAVGWDARLWWRCRSRLLRISWLQLRLCLLAELLPSLAWYEASLALSHSTVSLSAPFLHPVFQPCHCHFPSSAFLVERRGICVHILS